MNPRVRNNQTAEQLKRAVSGRRGRPAFTLIELLTVISIIGVLASMVMFALFSVQESARATRTKAQIAKINELLSTRWESYRTRPLPIRVPPGTPPRQAALARLLALRELMRMEMPDRISDLAPGGGNPVYHNYKDIRSLNLPPLRSSLFSTYKRRVTQVLPGQWQNRILDYDTPNLAANTGAGVGMWTPQYEGSECLYMILAAIQDGDSNGLDFFHENEIGDTDADGMPEILDGWGQPIDFIRWAPGFVGPAVSTIQFGDGQLKVNGDAGQGNGDPFDPLKVDPRWNDKTGTDTSIINPTANDPFALFPLVYSMGPDGTGGIARHGKIRNDDSKRFVGRGGKPNKNHFCVARHTSPPNDPYHHHGALDAVTNKTYPQGYIVDPSAFVDNISNHMLEAR